MEFEDEQRDLLGSKIRLNFFISRFSILLLRVQITFLFELIVDNLIYSSDVIIGVWIEEKLSTFTKDHPYLIGIAAVLIFWGLVLIVPFTGIIGGFFQQTITIPVTESRETSQNNEFLWDGVGYSPDPNYVMIYYEKLDNGSFIGRLWLLCRIWGFIFLIFPLVGSGLIIYYIASEFFERQTSDFFVKLGFNLGLLATIGEWVILFFTIQLEDWSPIIEFAENRGGTANIPNLNLILFSLSVIGWIVFIYGYKTILNPEIKNRYKPSEAKYVYHIYK
jgi:hypothetical protein